MKRIVLMMSVLLIGSGTVLAQKSNVSKAKNKAMSIESPDFAGAREAIKAALENDETKDQANTWYVAGLIGYQEYSGMQLQIQTNNYDVEKVGRIMMESIEYFKKADELGQIPDAKGKISTKPRREIQPKLYDYYNSKLLVIYGSDMWDAQRFEDAYKAFHIWAEIPMMDMMQEARWAEKMPLDTTYYLFRSYGARAALLAADKATDEAVKAKYRKIAQSEAEMLVNVNFSEAASMRAILEQIRVEEIQGRLNVGDYEGVFAMLGEAIQKDPNNATPVYMMAYTYAQKGDYEKAMEYCKKSIEIDPSAANSNAYYIYALSAKTYVLETLQKAPDAEYAQKLKELKSLAQDGRQYAQKAYDLNPSDQGYDRLVKEYDYLFENVYKD
ncbi:MAG: tetratricopeptide repeat protein [Paludibacteraceae bacterium]|nr:tetratricopeptide repeat protein [Paludibacteraceae bacterium]